MGSLPIYWEGFPSMGSLAIYGKSSRIPCVLSEYVGGAGILAGFVGVHVDNVGGQHYISENNLANLVEWQRTDDAGFNINDRDSDIRDNGIDDYGIDSSDNNEGQTRVQHEVDEHILVDLVGLPHLGNDGINGRDGDTRDNGVDDYGIDDNSAKLDNDAIDNDSLDRELHQPAQVDLKTMSVFMHLQAEKTQQQAESIDGLRTSFWNHAAMINQLATHINTLATHINSSVIAVRDVLDSRISVLDSKFSASCAG
jgi:hypothetical protein